MPDGFRLILPNSLFPVQAYFNVWPDRDFLPMLWRMSEGVESSYNDVGWSWWGGEDHTPLPKGQVLFYCGAEEICLEAGEAMGHLKDAARVFASAYPEIADEVSSLLDRISAKLTS